MLKTSDGIGQFPAPCDPVLRAGRSHYGRGRHGGPADQCRPDLRWLHPRRAGARQHPGLDLFGAISGSSVADTASIGSVMIPEMIRNGYPRLFAVNVTISGSLQPLLLPPSHNMVIYSLAAGGTVSIAHLFLAGIVPALLLGLSLMILCLIIARREGFPKGEAIPLRQALKIIVDAIWGLITVVIIIGGILTGVFTPTESGAVACVYALFVTLFIYRDYKLSQVPLLHRPGRAHGRHGHDHDRLLGRFRLHDGPDAGAGQGDGVLHRDLR